MDEDRPRHPLARDQALKLFSVLLEDPNGKQVFTEALTSILRAPDMRKDLARLDYADSLRSRFKPELAETWREIEQLESALRDAEGWAPYICALLEPLDHLYHIVDRTAACEGLSHETERAWMFSSIRERLFDLYWHCLHWAIHEGWRPESFGLQPHERLESIPRGAMHREAIERLRKLGAQRARQLMGAQRRSAEAARERDERRQAEGSASA